MLPHEVILPLLGKIGDGTRPLLLKSLAMRAGLSPHHLHRLFSRIVGEPPKRFMQRLRLERACGLLSSQGLSVLAVAMSCGFSSHEHFTRAFVRHFGCTPSWYRQRALRGVSPHARARHLWLTRSVGPCITLYQVSTTRPLRSATMPTLSITRKELAPQHLLFIRRRVSKAELPAVMAECFGTIYGHVQKSGLPLAGYPLARYLSMGPGLMTVEMAMPLTAPAQGSGEIQSGTLPAGPAAVGVHAGPYEQLAETHATIERWIEANGHQAGGAPWEWYVSDPADHPDPADWRTEVYWPLA